jgi:Cu/Zn superoxide dismutase
MKKLSILGIIGLLLATMSMALAQTSGPLTFQLKELEGSKVNGTATISAEGTGIKVSIKLSGFAPNTDHAGHIHQGKCEAQGPIIYPLTTLTAGASGAGTADTSLPNVTLASLTTGATTYYVQYHQGASPPGKEVSCANIFLAAGGGAQSTTVAAATTLAATPPVGQGGALSTDSGSSPQGAGFPLWGILAVLAVVIVVFGAGITFARQRTK